MMTKWLLLIMIFDVSDGGMKVVHQDTRVFATEATCNAEGRRMMSSVEYPGDDLRSMSICIPQSAFDD